MRQPIYIWIGGLQPTGKQIDRQWKAVHFGEERDEKRAKRAKAAPVTTCFRLEETEGEDDEDRRVDKRKRPQRRIC